MNNKWKVIRIGEILKVKSGRDQKDVECKNGKYQILGTGGEIGRTNSFLYNKPSVLIGRKGTIDKPFYKDEPFWTVDTLFYTEIKDGFVPKYIYYLFQTINWKKYNEASGVPSLTASTIENIVIQVSDLETQKKIVSILEKWDAATENLKRQILEEEKISISLKQNLLDGKNKVLKPTKWVKVKLSDVANFVNGYAFKSQSYCMDGEYKIVTIANVQEGSMNLDKINTVNGLPDDIGNEQILKPNDILVSMTGNVGRVCRVNDDRCLLNQRVGKIVPTKVNPDWLYFRLNSKIFISKMKNSAQGGAQDNISVKDIMGFTFAIPSPAEQCLIIDILSDQEYRLSLLRQKLSNYESQRKYLLNRLLSGKEDI